MGCRVVVVLVVLTLIVMPVLQFAASAVISHHASVKHKRSVMRGWRTAVAVQTSTTLPALGPVADAAEMEAAAHLPLLADPPFVPPRA